MTLDQFWQDYYLTIKTPLLRESTMIGYKSAYKNHIYPEFGETDLNDITIMQVEKWVLSFQTKGAAKKAYAVFRAIINLAYKWNYTQLNLSGVNIQYPKGEKYTPEILSLGELKKVLKTFKGHELEPLLICEICLGLRRGEACGLKWGDINFRKKTVSIVRSRQYISGAIVVVDPKTEKSKRTLPLPKFAIKRLKKLSKGKQPTEYMCPYSPDKISKMYKNHCELMEIKYVPMTNLRHSYATAMLSIGIDAAVVAKILGHTDVSTTYRYYLKPIEQTINKAQKHFERSFMKSF